MFFSVGCSYTALFNPLNGRYTNTSPTVDFAVFGNMFGLRLYYDDFENEPQIQKRKTSYVTIREWIRVKYGVCATNLQISQAKQRLGLTQLEYKGKAASGKYAAPVLSDEKFKIIEEAFQHFGVI